MKIFDVTKMNFRLLPKTDKVGNRFDSILIIPTGKLHDSGWGAFAIVGCKDEDAFCFVGEGSDALHLDGFCGFGTDWERAHAWGYVSAKGWTIDITPNGIFRLFARNKKEIVFHSIASDCEVFAEDRIK